MALFGRNPSSITATTDMEMTGHEDLDFHSGEEQKPGIEDVESNWPEDVSEEDAQSVQQTEPSSNVVRKPFFAKTGAPNMVQPATPPPTKPIIGMSDDRISLTTKISKELHARLKVHCFKTSIKQVDLVCTWIDENCPEL